MTNGSRVKFPHPQKHFLSFTEKLLTQRSTAPCVRSESLKHLISIDRNNSYDRFKKNTFLHHTSSTIKSTLEIGLARICGT